MKQTQSVSSIKLFKACRRAYQLRYVYGVYPVETAEVLKTGLDYHSGIEALMRDGTVPDIVDRESAMVNAYAKHIQPQMPKFEPEVWFERDVRGMKFVGRLDGKADGAIVEHKTTAMNLDEYEFDLQWNEQLLAYMWATGVNTAYFTMCKKPTIRQKQTETAEEFGQRCFEWYDDDTFQKIRLVKIVIPQEHIDSFAKEIKKDFRNVRQAARNDDFYRNTCHCNAWGRRCEYAPICHGYDPNETYVGFERRDDYANNENNG
jgi:hypothetical protein